VCTFKRVADVALYSDALGILAAIFVILCAVTGMSALTRFIEAIDKKAYH
jgi:hypothetical protein